jgi:amino acid transporter
LERKSVRRSRKLTVLPLIAATYFMVAGGPYGLEDLIGKAGYLATIVILVITPLLWSVPTALMVSELAAALPCEGGFYVWVRRAMGPFWGFQESWLTLTGSVFEMALYPTLFVAYLGRFLPKFASGYPAIALELALIAFCAGWNILGARAVGEGSIWLNALLFSPFVAIIFIALAHKLSSPTLPPVRNLDLTGGIVIAMWNYMGWDNLSTLADEVDRPQTTYPAVMCGSVILVTVSYLLPVVAVAVARLDPSLWRTGSWVDAGQVLGGS